MPGFVNAGTSASEQKGETTIPGTDRKLERKFWTPKRIMSVGAVAGFVGLVLYMAIFGDHSARLNVQVERITISEVTVGPFQEFIPQRGTVMPIQSHYLDALEGGQVEEIFLEEGAMVEKGTRILRMSNPSLEQTVLSQEAQLFEQINRMENTRLSQEIQDIQRKRDLMLIELDLQKSERDFRKQKALFENEISRLEKNSCRQKTVTIMPKSSGYLCWRRSDATPCIASMNWLPCRSAHGACSANWMTCVAR